MNLDTDIRIGDVVTITSFSRLRVLNRDNVDDASIAASKMWAGVDKLFIVVSADLRIIDMPSPTPTVVYDIIPMKMLEYYKYTQQRAYRRENKLTVFRENITICNKEQLRGERKKFFDEMVAQAAEVEQELND